jgi:hypothetical protein
MKREGAAAARRLDTTIERVVGPDARGMFRVSYERVPTGESGALIPASAGVTPRVGERLRPLPDGGRIGRLLLNDQGYEYPWLATPINVSFAARVLRLRSLPVVDAHDQGLDQGRDQAPQGASNIVQFKRRR